MEEDHGGAVRDEEQDQDVTERDSDEEEARLVAAEDEMVARAEAQVRPRFVFYASSLSCIITSRRYRRAHLICGWDDAIDADALRQPSQGSPTLDWCTSGRPS